ncbi:uncharacterized protein LOC143215907 [Lasioglossum baleicum]|uniref:uncharacterized protein LOC143215907 n=1 Tax=Lasioglossum baleicum TaxID=434251 RepID=UPI003FCE0003
MGTNCECQYTLMVMNEIVQGQLSEIKDNYNHVPSIHEVVEEDTDEEYSYNQDSPTVNDVQQDAGLAGNIVDDDSIYSNESFCSDDSSNETNVTSRTLNESHYTPKAADHECETKDNEEKCESPVRASGNVNSFYSSSSISDDRSTILKPVKCRRKNMSFTDEELRKIEWENQLLLRKIMAQQKPKEKILRENGSQTKQSSSAINRKKLQRKIESENIMLLQRLQQTKSRVMNAATRPGCRQTIL